MNKQDYKDQIIWIIGASSGIGSALAHELSSRGAKLALSSRRKDELENLKVKLGEHHKVFALDITDAETTLRTSQAIRASFGRIDRVVFLAAAYAPMKTDHLDLAMTKAMLDVNLGGAFNVIHAMLPILKAQPEGHQKFRGQITLCGSVAGYMGLPGGQPYSATKAGIINLAESLYAECKSLVDIKLISPGFVRTALTDKNSFEMPMIIEPEQAAKAIADGLLSPHFEIHFPKKFTFLLKILSLLPYSISLPIVRKIRT